MVKHIVMWKIKAPEGRSHLEVLKELKRELEGLKGKIRGLISIEVGLNLNSSANAYDAVLYSEFDDQEALEYYQKHEKHQYVANTYVRPFAESRKVVDYEC